MKINYLIILIIGIQYASCFELTAELFESMTTSYSYFSNSTDTYNGTSVMTIDLFSKGISSIHPDAFKKYKHAITRIRLSYNKLGAISPAVFEGMNKLSYLELTGAQLTDLTLPCLPNLETLTLGINQLTKFNYKVSTCFPNLVSLDLGYNQFVDGSLAVDTFQFAFKLRDLRLPGNLFKVLDTSLFKNLPSLNGLYLERNQFTRIDPFEYLPITYLELFQNSISYIHPFAFMNLPRLGSIGLNNNKLTSLDPAIFKYNSQLNGIFCSNNLLTTLTAEFLASVPTLAYIYMAGNQFTTFDPKIFCSIRDLNTLDLQSNKISALPLGIFDCVKKVQTINLSANLLASVDPAVFTDLPNLRMIYFRNNPLKTAVDTEAIKKAANSTYNVTFYL